MKGAPERDCKNSLTWHYRRIDLSQRPQKCNRRQLRTTFRKRPYYDQYRHKPLESTTRTVPKRLREGSLESPLLTVTNDPGHIYRYYQVKVDGESVCSRIQKTLNADLGTAERRGMAISTLEEFEACHRPATRSVL